MKRFTLDMSALRVGDEIEFRKYTYSNASGGTEFGRKPGKGKIIKHFGDYETGLHFHVQLDDVVAYVSEFDIVCPKAFKDESFNVAVPIKTHLSAQGYYMVEQYPDFWVEYCRCVDGSWRLQEDSWHYAKQPGTFPGWPEGYDSEGG